METREQGLARQVGCPSPDAVGALTLVLGSSAVNNDTNSRKFWAAMTQFIF
jgi:hypothetical protein